MKEQSKKILKSFFFIALLLLCFEEQKSYASEKSVSLLNFRKFTCCVVKGFGKYCSALTGASLGSYSGLWCAVFTASVVDHLIKSLDNLNFSFKRIVFLKRAFEFFKNYILLSSTNNLHYVSSSGQITNWQNFLCRFAKPVAQIVFLLGSMALGSVKGFKKGVELFETRFA